MSKKRNKALTKEKWQAVRQNYTWHLHSPFKDEFDRSHWWEGRPESEIEPVAALYELARRHPRVGEVRRTFRRSGWYGQELREPLSEDAAAEMSSLAFDDVGREPKAIHCLCLIGLLPWPKLSWRSKDYWKMSAGKMKGVDCRDDIEKCQSITLDALSTIALNRVVSLKPGPGALQVWVHRDTNNSKITPVNPQAFHDAKNECNEPLFSVVTGG